MDDIKPRQLTDEEIAYIVDVLPNIESDDNSINCCSPEFFSILRTSIRSTLSELLRRVELTPLEIDGMRNEIERCYHSAQIEAGEPIGLRCAQAFMKNVMQSTLDSSHAAGTLKSVTKSLKTMSDLINAVPPKNPSLTIVLSDPFPTYEQVFDMRWVFASTYLSDLLLSDPILHNTVDLLFGEEGDDGKLSEWKSEYNSFLPSFYQDYIALMPLPYGLPFLQSTQVLRIELSASTMYVRRVTVDEVVRALELSHSNICIRSPLTDGVYTIDIYARMDKAMSKVNKWRSSTKDSKSPFSKSINKDEDGPSESSDLSELPSSKKKKVIPSSKKKKIIPSSKTTPGRRKIQVNDIPDDRVVITYLTSIVLPSIGKLHLKGVQGIKAAYPVTLNVWSVVEKMTSVSMDMIPPRKNLWLLAINQIIQQTTGLSMVHLRALMAACSIDVIEIEGDKELLVDITNAIKKCKLCKKENIQTPHKSIDDKKDHLLFLRLHYGTSVDMYPLIKRLINPTSSEWRKSMSCKCDGVECHLNSCHLHDVRALEVHTGRLTELSLTMDYLRKKLSSDKDFELMQPLDSSFFDNKYIFIKLKRNEKERVMKKDTCPIIITPKTIIDHLLAEDEKEEETYRQVQESRRNDILMNARNTMDDEEKEILLQQSRSIVITRPATDLKRYSIRVYLETDGTNLSQVLVRDDVDPLYTFSNNVFEILKEFGIEASVNFLINTFRRTIERDGGTIDPRHPILLSNIMCSLGHTILGSSWTSAKTSDFSILQQAAIERPLDVLSGAAAFGTQDPIKGVIPCLMIGKPVDIGTDSVKLFPLESDTSKQSASTSDDCRIEDEVIPDLFNLLI